MGGGPPGSSECLQQLGEAWWPRPPLVPPSFTPHLAPREPLSLPRCRTPSVTWPWAQSMLQPAGRPGHGGGQNRPVVGATAGSLVLIARPRAMAMRGLLAWGTCGPLGSARTRWGGNHPTWGQDGGSEGLSYLPGAARRPDSQLGPCVSVGWWLSPLPAPHLSTKNAVCPGGRLLGVQTAGVGCRDAVDSRHGVPAHSESAPATEPQSAGVVQGGSASVSAHLHDPLSTLPCRPPTLAATPSRQMCRGGGGAIPGDAALSAPGGPRYSRHLLPSPMGEGGLAHGWRRSSTHPSPLRGGLAQP